MQAQKKMHDTPMRDIMHVSGAQSTKSNAREREISTRRQNKNQNREMLIMSNLENKLDKLLAAFEIVQAENEQLKKKLTQLEKSNKLAGKANNVSNKLLKHYLDNARDVYVKRDGTSRTFTISAFVVNYFQSLLERIVKAYKMDAKVYNRYGQLFIFPTRKHEEIKVGNRLSTAFKSGEFAAILRAIGAGQRNNMGSGAKKRFVGEYWSLFERDMYMLIGRMMFAYDFSESDLHSFVSDVMRVAIKSDDTSTLDTVIDNTDCERPNETVQSPHTAAETAKSDDDDDDDDNLDDDDDDDETTD